MSTNIEKAKKAIVMKTGLVFWVEQETAEKIERSITQPDFQHQFVRITELGETINTSQIEGFYTHETMQDLEHIKRGERRCQWGKYHKRIDDCECYRDAARARREREEAEQRAKDARPLSPEEQARLAEVDRKDIEMRALDGSSLFRGMFAPGGRSKKVMRMATVKEWETKNGKAADLEGIALDTPA